MAATPGVKSQARWHEPPRARALRLLQEWIREGVFPAGSVLPSERHLAAKMGMALATVQRALHILNAEGIINKKGRTQIVASPKTESLLTNVVAVLAPPDAPQRLARDRTPVGGEAGYLRYIPTGALSAIQKRGLHAIALQPTKLDGEQLERLLAQRPLGVVIPEFDRNAELFPQLMQALVKSKVPFVVGDSSPEYQAYDRVFSDHEVGGYRLTKWLIERGRKRILCMLPCKQVPWVNTRYQGYCRAMGEAGLNPMPLLTDDIVNIDFPDQVVEFRVKSTYLAGRLMPYFSEAPALDAILATNDRHAYEVREACMTLGCESDDSLWVTGYDNFYDDIKDFMAQFNVPLPVATMDKRNFEVGEALVELLLERVAGALPPEPQERRVAPTFVPLRP